MTIVEYLIINPIMFMIIKQYVREDGQKLEWLLMQMNVQVTVVACEAH